MVAARRGRHVHARGRDRQALHHATDLYGRRRPSPCVRAQQRGRV